MNDDRWLEAFHAFFGDESLRARLRAIGLAGGCREGWLQGEMFHFFKNLGIDLQTNRFCISDQSDYLKADLYVPGPCGLVAECKVLGKWDYANKMLDGAGVRAPQARLRSTGELRYSYEDLRVLDEPGEGLLRDFFRLALSRRIDRDFSRLLILVIHTDPPTRFEKIEQANNEGDSLGKLLLRVAFGDPEDEHAVLDEAGLMVKIWRIKPQEVRLEQ